MSIRRSIAHPFALAGCTLLLVVSARPLHAQKTVVTDAGPGLKQELDYDAAGHLLEARTVTTDGKLQVRVQYFLGAYGEVQKSINTSYWFDGKTPEKVAQNTFDENLNFTNEVIEDFDQSGKHVSGHKLFHNPQTGVYRCFDWDAAGQKYLAVECPASEESHEGPKDIRKITREEVLKQLAAAREKAHAENPEGNGQAQFRSSDDSATAHEVGILIPNAIRPGQRVSGSIVTDPDRFEGHPGLMVARVILPSNASPQLRDWTVEVSGSAAQPARSPIIFTVPVASKFVDFTLRSSGGTASSITKRIDFSMSSVGRSPRPGAYQSPALCFKRGVCEITGVFSGDSRDSLFAFEGEPARVLAQTDSVAFVEVPATANIGSSLLILAEGNTLAAMAMTIADVRVNPAHDDVQPGHAFGTELLINGVDELADQQWHYGVYPAGSLQRARDFVPGFDPAKTAARLREQNEKQSKRDGLPKKEEKWEESAGIVLVVLQNLTPDVGSFRGGNQKQLVFNLTPDSFGRGDFKYNLSVDAVKAGAVRLHAVAIPFLAPVQAQMFEPDSTKRY